MTNAPARRPGLAEHRKDKAVAMRARCPPPDRLFIGGGGPDIGGFGLGPSSPELLCAVISTCLMPDT
ncbi:hypothetical protein [Streptomyces sp. NPDC058613]|uniref:hypothetical protein n=1 Tax=Streptomyces sp. NPDC058613 TaxID=3346556 RepID=UPI00365C3090